MASCTGSNGDADLLIPLCTLIKHSSPEQSNIKARLRWGKRGEGTRVTVAFPLALLGAVLMAVSPLCAAISLKLDCAGETKGKGEVDSSYHLSRWLSRKSGVDGSIPLCAALLMMIEQQL